MKSTLSYVFVTPYTIAKSRTGGVVSRLLSRLDLELVGAQIIAADSYFARSYAEILRSQDDPKNPGASSLLASYVEENMGPSGGRPHRTLLLLFRGQNACKKLSDICGALYPENRGVESLTGETIRDTYADLIVDDADPKKIIYFEPAVLTPRNQKAAHLVLSLLASWLPGQPNIVENMVYPHPQKIQRTLVILKPDNWRFASSRPGTIIDMFSRTGLRIVGMKVHRMSISEALEFYGPVREALRKKLGPVFGKKARELLESELKISLTDEAQAALIESFGREYAEDQFEQIIEFMSGKRPSVCPLEMMIEPGSVKCMILVYEGEDATDRIRAVLGPTNPQEAPGGTVRREFGHDVMVNTAHASDSPESAKREMGVVRIQENPCADIIRSYINYVPGTNL
jgi:nucleoside diphosphate kinase